MSSKRAKGIGGEDKLRRLSDAELREKHAEAMQLLYRTHPSGPARLGVAATRLEPVEREMRRRGMEADYWSREHLRRSVLHFNVEDLERGLDYGFADNPHVDRYLRWGLGWVTSELEAQDDVADEPMRLRLDVVRQRLTRELHEREPRRRQ